MGWGRAASRESAPNELWPSAVGAAMRWWVVLLVVVLVLAVLTFFSAFAASSCGFSACDFGAFVAAQNTFYLGALALLIGALVGIYLARAHGKAAIAAPVISLMLVVILFGATYAAARAALDLPLTGGRL
ncbi:hypothetical protein AB0N73_06745 [Microbacterium sp. NPDC089189]|uniref:hypothetical protein n=1 Tax=Microbacterium sp. NPDC089189 TaxID=3154972 RepID=UPI0034237856